MEQHEAAKRDSVLAVLILQGYTVPKGTVLTDIIRALELRGWSFRPTDIPLVAKQALDKILGDGESPTGRHRKPHEHELRCACDPPCSPSVEHKTT